MRWYLRAAMDDAARATTDAMMRYAAAAMGEDNQDVELRCECLNKTARNTQHEKSVIRRSAQVPRRVRQDRLCHAAAVRGEAPEHVVSLLRAGRRRDLFAS